MSPILFIFLCLFEFLCTIYYLIMTILISINSSYKDKEKMGWIVSVECIVQDLCRFKVFIFHSENQAQTQKMVRKIIHGTIICMGNIKIPLLDTLRITKSLVRKIYLSGAWEPPLPTLLIPPYPKEWTKITCAQEEHILNLPASLEYLR